MTAVRPAAAATDLAPDERCIACEHALAQHDAISTRYCEATQARALSRDCICRTATT